VYMDSISKHISYKEGTRSSTAVRLGIKNDPNDTERLAMCTLSKNIFEPLRDHVCGPIRINSFFRSAELNKKIGGSSTSQHCKGEAFDLDDSYGHKTNAEMYAYIKANLSFDQMIWEFGNEDNPNWIHVSYVSEEENRGQCLRAYKENGKTKYSII
jgi:zinc D-Ala-D-Ala carboxypeptidase